MLHELAHLSPVHKLVTEDRAHYQSLMYLHLIVLELKYLRGKRMRPTIRKPSRKG